MELIIEISILMTYLLMVIKGWLPDNDYIIWMIWSYLGWSMVRAFMYKQSECKKNKRLSQCIYRLMNETVHEITEILKDQNWILKFSL